MPDAGLIVERPGLAATVQDGGRPGYRHLGVPVGGAFDRRGLALANALVGNRPDAAAIELTGVGGHYRAEGRLRVALAGAPMAAELERAGGSGARRLAIPVALVLEPGDRLAIGGCASGLRTYLAVAGGWLVPIVMGSRSSERRLVVGDRLPAAGWEGDSRDRRPAPGWIGPGDDGPLRVIDGPDGDASIDWDSHDFRVGAPSDRVGLRLESAGPPLAIEAPLDRLSAPVTAGAVQVAGGRPIVLGVACGTMGGYPHVAQVISADLDRLGQLAAGSAVRFQRIELAEARRLDRQSRARRSSRWLVLATASGFAGRFVAP